MKPLSGLYAQSLALLTDLYELTMAYGHWKLGVEREAVFHLFFRSHPFHGGFTVAAGLESVLDFIDSFRFTDDDCEYLGSLTGADGQPLFERGFLDYLRGLRLQCDVDAVPEGTVVFPQEPLVRVKGPILEAQILETALLTLVNFQSLIATKSARVALAARGDAVLEFGLRRAQGIDGGLSASRAAYLGGAAATSNVLAGKLYGIPVKGTHAHSWVMAFDDELASFEAYAQAMPNNCVFLVDTYNTLQGVRHAAQVGLKLRAQGHRLLGIRLDSGDLAWLSQEARKILDEAGLQDTQILASNDLDEHLIESLKQQGATISVWGVGTKLVTAYDQPALGGVYKLSAVRHPGEPWQWRLKLSEQIAKISTPGIHQVRRYRRNGEFAGDVIYQADEPLPDAPTIVDPLDFTRRKRLPASDRHEDLLVPVVRSGRRVYDLPSLDDSRRRCADQLAGFHPGITRFLNPHEYPVGYEQGLFDLKTRLVLEARRRRG